jgi:hypothetical protein
MSRRLEHCRSVLSAVRVNYIRRSDATDAIAVLLVCGGASITACGTSENCFRSEWKHYYHLDHHPILALRERS